jgi:hypothetical protein
MPPDFTRRSFLGLLPAAAIGLTTNLEAEGLDVRMAGESIRVTAPQLRFVTGNPLERLKNGAPVPFALQLSLSTDHWASVAVRDIERFVLSYDLWEEKFSIAKMGRPRRLISHLAAHAAESWCVGEMSLATAGISEQQQFWVRLEARAENPAEQAELERQESVSLARLIDMFSRRARGDQNRWAADAGPLRLIDLKKAAAEVKG